MSKYKVKDFLKMTYDEVRKLNAEEVKGYTKVVTDAANKRLKRLIEARSEGVYSLTVSRYYAKETGQKYLTQPVNDRTNKEMYEELKYKRNVRNATRAENMQSLTSLGSFLKNKTSTVAGARAVQTETYNRFNEVTKANMPMELFWKMWNRFYKEYVLDSHQLDSEQLRDAIINVWENGGVLGVEDEQSIETMTRAYIEGFLNKYDNGYKITRKGVNLIPTNAKPPKEFL